MRFRDALAEPGLGAIAEFKRRSPSLGDIRPDAEPGALAADYARAGAAAVSVLVDERFAGDWDDLRAARASVTLPLLAKGFFSTAEHLRTAKEAGADAVLLLLRDLDDGQTATLMALAAELGLDTLVEAHDAAELERAIALGAPVIGINARDLSTFAIDRSAQLDLVAQSSDLPPPRSSMAESGIHTRAQGAAAELAGRGRRPRRLGADAGARPGREAARAARAPARQGLRPDPRGGRGRRGRGRRRSGGLRPRSGEPARRARGAPRSRDDARGRRLGRRGRGERGDPRPGARARCRQGPRPRRRPPPRAGRRSRRWSTCPGARRIPATGSAPRRPRVASSSRAGSTARTWPRRSAPCSPWAVDASSRLEAEPGIKDPDKVTRVRGGGSWLRPTGPTAVATSPRR